MAGLRALLPGVLVLCLAACSTTGPITVSAPQSQPATSAALLVAAPAVAGKPDDCSVDPTLHILAIDKRGGYRPIFMKCSDGRIFQQVRPGHWSEDGCIPVQFAPLIIRQEQVDSYSALQCQIQRIIQALRHPPDGRRQHLVIFIHGGLVTQRDSLDRASTDTPQMIRDTHAFDAIPDSSGGGSQALMQGSEIFPLFLNWPSGPFDTYDDAITDYKQGIYDGPERHMEAPLYLGNDLAEIGVRAPLDLVKSVHRFLGSEHEIHPDEGCNLENFGCNDTGTWSRPPGQGAVYVLTTPLRLLTVPALDVGTDAWKNMIARTRFGIEKYVDPGEFERVFRAEHPLPDGRPASQQGPGDAGQREQKEILTKGAFYLFFEELKRQPGMDGRSQSCERATVRITLIGHSMGSMVSNEILREFPQLPYENIVYMAAASSIRDFRSMTEPVLVRPPCSDLRFYNLSLHQEWDAKEIEVGGAAPEGSLLEWIDDIFETPVTPIDRTLGKWQNVIYAEDEFNPVAAGRMFFHRFGLGAPDPLMHGEFAEMFGPVTAEPDATCGAIPFWRPQFWAEVRVGVANKGCPPVQTLVSIREKSAPPLARPQLK